MFNVLISRDKKGKLMSNSYSDSTLAKAELAELVHQKVGINRRDAKVFVDEFFEEIRAALARGEEVKLSGFGSFTLREKAARPGRNPKTGEAAVIPARRVVSFYASQKLKDSVIAAPSVLQVLDYTKKVQALFEPKVDSMAVRLKSRYADERSL